MFKLAILLVACIFVAQAQIFVPSGGTMLAQKVKCGDNNQGQTWHNVGQYPDAAVLRFPRAAYVNGTVITAKTPEFLSNDANFLNDPYIAAIGFNSVNNPCANFASGAQCVLYDSASLGKFSVWPSYMEFTFTAQPGCAPFTGDYMLLNVWTYSFSAVTTPATTTSAAPATSS